MLCRRSSLPIAAPPVIEPAEASAPVAPGGRGSGLVLTWLLSVLASASIGALIAWKALEASDAAKARAARADTRAAALIAEPAPALDDPPRAQPAAADPAAKAANLAEQLRRLNEPPPARAPAASPTAAPPTLQDQLKLHQAQSDQLSDEQRHKQIENDMNARAIAAARRNVTVEMFSTTWCGVCTVARNYMQTHRIAFVDHDIDKEDAARERARALNPRLSVPVIDVAGSVMIGFSEKKLEDNLDRAARKRVGL